MRYDYDFAPPQTPNPEGRGDTWWRRTFTDEYLPALSLDNASVKAYMSQQGWAWPGRYRRSEESGGGGGGEAAWRQRLRGWPNGVAGAAVAGVMFAAVLMGADVLATRVLLEGFVAAEDSVSFSKDKVA